MSGSLFSQSEQLDVYWYCPSTCEEHRSRIAEPTKNRLPFESAEHIKRVNRTEASIVTVLTSTLTALAFAALIFIIGWGLAQLLAELVSWRFLDYVEAIAGRRIV